MSETAQVELKSGRVKAPAAGISAAFESLSGKLPGHGKGHTREGELDAVFDCMSAYCMWYSM